MELSLEQITMISEEYVKAPHRPKSQAYANFIDETYSQYAALILDGWILELTNVSPYSTSAEMFADCDNKHLKIFSGGKLAEDNPLREASGWMADTRDNVRGYESLSYNEMFRAVHDINGHYRVRAPFETIKGELDAYSSHKQDYHTVGGRFALYSETVGQLCYYYANGEKFVEVQENKIIPVRF